MTTSIARTLTLCLLACGALAGCSSDADSEASGDTSSDTSVETGSGGDADAAEYQDAVNSICTAGNERIDALFANGALGPDATEAQLTGMLDQILAELDGQMTEIEALDPPESLVADVDAWLAESRTTAEEVRSDGAAFFDQQAAGENPFAAVNADAVALGLNACGE
jgi:hypothetical protein